MGRRVVVLPFALTIGMSSQRGWGTSKVKENFTN